MRKSSAGIHVREEDRRCGRWARLSRRDEIEILLSLARVVASAGTSRHGTFVVAVAPVPAKRRDYSRPNLGRITNAGAVARSGLSRVFCHVEQHSTLIAPLPTVSLVNR